MHDTSSGRSLIFCDGSALQVVDEGTRPLAEQRSYIPRGCAMLHRRTVVLRILMCVMTFLSVGCDDILVSDVEQVTEFAQISCCWPSPDDHTGAYSG